MKRYEITYKHSDMPKQHLGKTTKWASDEKKALSLLCIRKPDKAGYCITKKGARLQILSVKCT
jgi:hypothetical protein|tara:strand:+ start:169 stop:357 length:189 start_codon:yes stop_codon:yes gene_type:complete